MSRFGFAFVVIAVMAATGCTSIPWEERVYRDEDCPNCVPTKGKVPILKSIIPLGACRGGCGEVYWGEWRSDPPGCDHCNCAHCNCAHCGTHGDCGECAGCSPELRGPMSSITLRALTGGQCDSPGCQHDSGCDVNPPPSRAVYYHDQAGHYADRSRYDHARSSPAPGPHGLRTQSRGYAAGYEPGYQPTYQPGPGYSRSAQSQAPNAARPGIHNYGYAVDDMGWDIMGSAGAGPRRAPIVERGGALDAPRSRVTRRLTDGGYPATPGRTYR